MFLKSLHKTPSGILVNGGILEEPPSNDPAVCEAGRGDEFDIRLNTLPGTLHLFVRLWDMLRVRGMDSHDALFFEEAAESRDGAGITALHKLDPENDQAGIGIASAHIPNQFDFLRRMLIGMRMGAS